MEKTPVDRVTRSPSEALASGGTGVVSLSLADSNFKGMDLTTLALILDHLPVGICIMSLDENELLYSNGAMETLCGWMRMAEPGLLHSAASEESEAHKFLMDDQDKPTEAIEWDLLAKDGKHWLSCLDKAVKWVDDRYVHLQIVTDITDKKRMEGQLSDRTTALTVRLSELRCLYAVSDLLEHSGQALEEIFDELIIMLPEGLPDSDMARVMVRFDGEDYGTAVAEDCPWVRRRPISVHGFQRGELIVHYAEAPAGYDEQSFSAQDNSLLIEVAKRLGIMVERRESFEALELSETRLSQAQRMANIGNWEWDVTQNDLWWSDEVYRIFGLRPHAFRPTYDAFIQRVHPDDRRVIRNEMRSALKGAPYSSDHRIVLRNGSVRIVHAQGAVVFDGDGRPTKMHGTIQDVTDRKQVEGRLRKLSQAVEQSPVSVFITDVEGTIEYVNQAFLHITGYAKHEVIGRKPNFLSAGETPGERYEELWATILKGGDWQGELLNRRKDGETFWDYTHISPVKDDKGDITHFIAIKEDISLRKEQEETIIRQAYYDALTGLPNRLLAMDRIQQSMHHSHRTNSKAAVMFIDLDEFKMVNDTLGHEAGDQLLTETARRLEGVIREDDTVARLGGDEFMVVMSELQLSAQAEIIARRIIEVCSEHYDIMGHKVTVTCSIGMAIYPDDGADHQVLLKNADAAMYRSKELGKNSYSFFTSRMNDEAKRRFKVETQLRGAKERGEMVPYFQPILDLQTGEVAGAEVLLRWFNDELGTVSPTEFIPLAESMGLINAIGNWVLDRAAGVLHSQLQKGHKDFRMAVNFSPSQFRGTGILETMAEVLEQYDLPEGALEVEITEGLLLENRSTTDALLTQLKDLGCALSIDDFGTGYSALSYLNQFPFDKLKIDRSFIKDIDTAEENYMLVRTIIGMAHDLGLNTTAEGAETQAELATLKQLGCDWVQGYYISRPVPEAQFLEFLEEWDPSRIADLPELPSPIELPKLFRP